MEIYHFMKYTKKIKIMFILKSLYISKFLSDVVACNGTHLCLHSVKTMNRILYMAPVICN